MRSTTFPFVIALSLMSSVLAAPPAGNLGQLQKLNRASEATLERLQRPLPDPGKAEKKSDAEIRLDRRQQAELRWLQEKQRRDLLWLNRRSRPTARPGVSPSLKGIDMQRRFELQQQRQLNRFRLQRPLSTGRYDVLR